MKELRLTWEPENQTPLTAIEGRLRSYRAGRRALNEARFLTDFRTVELKEGGYMVAFHNAVSVLVGADEFAAQRGEVTARIAMGTNDQVPEFRTMRVRSFVHLVIRSPCDGRRGQFAVSAQVDEGLRRVLAVRK